MEVWLALLIREIDQLPDRPDWLQEARDDWHEQATGGFGFGIVMNLDRFVSDETRRSLLASLVERALGWLARHSDSFTRDELNAMGVGGQRNSFTRDVPTEVFARVGRYFQRLLDGTLSLQENDARILD